MVENNNNLFDLQRIRKIINWYIFQEYGKSATEIAAKLGYTKSSLSQILNEQVPISQKFVDKLCSIDKNINKDWISGKGKMLLNDVGQNTFSISEFKQRGYAPYYSELKVSAGQYDLAVIEKNEEPESWIKFPGIIAEAWFPIIGCSMEPKIYAGDTLGVVKIEHWEKVDPDKIYLVITIYDRMIKQLVVDENSNEYLWAVSLNHPRIKVLYSEIITIYRVVWAGRLV